VPHISLVFRKMWDTTALSVGLSIHPTRLAINIGGIPHLAKNERDMGHPSSVREPGVRTGGSHTLSKAPYRTRLNGTAEAVPFVWEDTLVGY
jgi:hypothetical protein